MSSLEIPGQIGRRFAASYLTRERTDRLPLFCLVLVLALAGILDVIVAFSMSPTNDERDYISYGVKILHSQPDRSGYLRWNSKTPISALNALPKLTGDLLQRRRVLHRAAAILQEMRVARLPSVLSLLLLTWFVYRWGYELYGVATGLACSAMAALSQNLIAHGTLATTDGYFALGVIASLYFFRHYLLRPTLRNACISTCILAFAQLTKPFMFYLYAVVFGFLILHRIRASENSPRLSGKHVMAYFALAAAFFITVLNIGYTFSRTLVPLRSYQFESTSFKALQHLPLAPDVPIPLPYAYLRGLDTTKYCDDARRTFGNIYLLGELQRVNDPGFHNFKSYYLIAWFFKEPIALQILFALGLLWLFRNRGWNDFVVGEGLLLAAATVLVLWQSLLRNSQIEIRNILPALAVELIVAGAMFANLSAISRLKKVGLVLLIGWLGVSTLSYYPHMIPYMNEWVVDRRMSYKLLADSNIDWGQNEYLVQEFLRKNPDVKLNPQEPTSGRVLVSVNRLVGISPAASTHGLACTVPALGSHRLRSLALRYSRKLAVGKHARPAYLDEG